VCKLVRRSLNRPPHLLPRVRRDILRVVQRIFAGCRGAWMDERDEALLRSINRHSLLCGGDYGIVKAELIAGLAHSVPDVKHKPRLHMLREFGLERLQAVVPLLFCLLCSKQQSDAKARLPAL